MTLDVNLGQVLEIGAFIGSVAWAHLSMKARVEQFMSTLQRHERVLDEHGIRLNLHGERIASLDGRRHGPH